MSMSAGVGFSSHMSRACVTMLALQSGACDFVGCVGKMCVRESNDCCLVVSAFHECVLIWSSSCCFSLSLSLLCNHHELPVPTSRY